MGADTLCRSCETERDAVRHIVAPWIKDKLGSSFHHYKCVSIIPVFPKSGSKAKTYALLKFLDVNYARH